MIHKTIPVAVLSRAYVGGLSITGSNPAEGMDVLSFVFVVWCVGCGLCDKLITRSEKSYRLCVCV
jgi:hypothetical protein